MGPALRSGVEGGELIVMHSSRNDMRSATSLALHGVDASRTTSALMRPHVFSAGIAAAMREPARLLVGRKQSGVARDGLAMGAAAGFGSGGWDAAAMLQIAQRESGVVLPLFETGAAEPERAQAVLKAVSGHLARPGVWLPRTVVHAGRSLTDGGTRGAAATIGAGLSAGGAA